jgi:hypothetical protein
MSQQLSEQESESLLNLLRSGGTMARIDVVKRLGARQRR